MPSNPVLTTASTLMCAHGGRVVVQGTQHSLTVAGSPVLLFRDLTGATISGCATAPTSSTKPCLTVTSALSGASSKLTVGGAPVATNQAHGLTDGVAGGPGTWQVTNAGQTKLAAS